MDYHIMPLVSHTFTWALKTFLSALASIDWGVMTVVGVDHAS